MNLALKLPLSVEISSQKRLKTHLKPPFSPFRTTGFAMRKYHIF